MSTSGVRLAEAIDLVPVGELPKGTLETLAARLSQQVELACHVGKHPALPLAPIPGREQLDANALLAALEAQATRERLLVGVAGEDIAIPIFTFVFGLARPGGRACVVSLARADPSFYGLPADPVLRDERVVAEIRHELGHLASLEHCRDHSCLMSFAGSIERADSRGAAFCVECRERLPGGWQRVPEQPDRPRGAGCTLAGMSSPARHHRYTYEEYRRLEDESDVRHEYLEGDIYAMAGGTPEHAAKAGEIVGILRAQLPPGCRVFTSDLRVRIPASGLTTYPDAAVICGGVLRASDDPLAAVNPVLLAEVTSPSTEEYDRGEKLKHFQKLPGLREVLIASHREARLTLHRRDGETWHTFSAGPGETLPLAAIGGSIAVDEVHRDEFKAGTS